MTVTASFGVEKVTMSVKEADPVASGGLRKLKSDSHSDDSIWEGTRSRKPTDMA